MTAHAPPVPEPPPSDGALAPTNAPEEVVVRVRVTSVLLLFAAVVLAILVRGVFVAAHRTIGWAVACALLAVLLTPVVQLLDRRMPKVLAYVITLLGFGLLAVLLWADTRHQIVRGLQELKVEAPKAAAALEQRNGLAAKADLTTRVQDLVSRIPATSGTQEATRIAGTAFAYFVPGILTLFLMVYGPRMVAGALGQLPERRRPRAEALLHGSVHDMRVQVGILVLEIATVGTLIGVLTWILGLPAPFLLGLIAGFFAVLPAMGIVIGTLPAVLFGAAFGSVTDAVLLLVVALGLQALEVLVVRPWIRQRAGDVGPALIVVVTLIAFALYGIGGATYALLALILLMAVVRQLAIDGTLSVTGGAS